MKVVSLICKRDLEMGLLCLNSLMVRSKDPFELELVDDGSLSVEDRERFKCVMPGVNFRNRSDIIEESADVLERFPAAFKFARENIFGVKLLALPLLAQGAQLNYIDSDIYFNFPFSGLFMILEDCDAIFLLDDGVPGHKVAANPMQRNIADRFRHPAGGGYSAGLLRLCAQYRLPLAKNLNAGMYSLRTGVFDLDLAEWFLKKNNLQRFPHLVEQTCWALLAGRMRFKYWSPEQFFCSEQPLPSSRPLGVHFITKHKFCALDYIREDCAFLKSSDTPACIIKNEDGRLISPADVLLWTFKKFYSRIFIA